MLNEMMITLAKPFSSLFPFRILPAMHTYNTYTFSPVGQTHIQRTCWHDPHTEGGDNTGRCGQIELNVPVHKLVVALCAESRWKKGSGTFGAYFPTHRRSWSSSSRCLRYKYRGNSISSGGVCGSDGSKCEWVLQFREGATLINFNLLIIS